MNLVEETLKFFAKTTQLVEEEKIPFKKGYLGICNVIRRKFDDGEDFWNHVMKTKKKITEKQFLSKVNPEPLLDDDESWNDYRDTFFGESLEAYYAKATYGGNEVYFLATGGTNGFEYFWVV